MNIVTLLDMVASVDPDRVILGDSRDGLTLAQLRDLADRAAHLLADHPGRPLLFSGTASPAFPVALFGAAVAGRAFAPVSYRLAPGPYAELVTDQLPATLLAEPGGCAGLEPGPDLTLCTPDAFVSAARAAARTPLEAGQDPEAPAVLLHTSGTTGKPKVAVLRHRHLTSYVLDGTEMLGAGADEAALVSVPPYHIAGVAGLLTGVYSGRRIVQLPNFTAEDWVATASAQGITHAMVVPTMLARIVEVLERTGETLPALRHLSYGGGRMPRPVIERALALLPHVGFVNAYGLTETTSSIAVLGPQEHRDAVSTDDPVVRARLESVGRALPSVEIVCRGPLGEPCEAGTHGELWVRGAQVSGEYAASSRLDEEGWFRTHDAGWIDAEGYVFVEGRLDDVIVRGGENLSPGEIESVLLQHPGVQDAVVYGAPDDVWGEVVVAAVVRVPAHEVGVEELRDWVAAHLRSSRVPAQVRFLTEVPRNDMGKVLRRVLRADTGTTPAVFS
ncbi:class I adenylate-forming enzyme family protein [Nocardioides ochotonae]|uniref:class I adenylate-forming enzyme family protein n=1 Tax=Nocardioides ochotonae TaxID=2685869 RepID=UPI0014095FB6|nr:fatty acid--CoA ligase family protein [Nocardioides ochotonae]